MCLDRGCDQPDADHGDPRHITWAMLRAAALASEIDPEEAAERILAAVRRIRDTACEADQSEPGDQSATAERRVTSVR